MTTRDQDRPLAAVLTAVVSEVAYLLQTELRLARAEAKEKLGQLANGGVLLAIGAALVLPGIVIGLLAIVRWLSIAGLAEEWGLTLVALAVLAIGAGLAISGMNALRATSLVPERTIEQVRADLSVAKETVK